MSERPRNSKKRCQYRHAKRRFLQRQGVEVSNGDLDSLVRIIQRGEAEFVERQSLRITKWRVDVFGMPCVVVYDRSRKSIVTVLTDEMVQTEKSI